MRGGTLGRLRDQEGEKDKQQSVLVDISVVPHRDQNTKERIKEGEKRVFDRAQEKEECVGRIINDCERSETGTIKSCENLMGQALRVRVRYGHTSR